MTANIEVKILRRLNIYRIKFILWGEKIFFSINGKKYKEVKVRRKKKKKQFHFEKKLKIKNVSYTLVFGDKYSSIKTLFTANAITFLSDFLLFLFQKQVDIKKIEKNIFPKFNENGIKLLINFYISGKEIYLLFYNFVASKLRKKRGELCKLTN